MQWKQAFTGAREQKPGRLCGDPGTVPGSHKAGWLAASVVCRSLGKYKRSHSRALEIPLHQRSKTSLPGIVRCKGVLSLLNLLILLSLILPTPPHSHRFPGSPLSVPRQIYPAGTSSGPGTIKKLMGWRGCCHSPKDRGLIWAEPGFGTKLKVWDRNSPQAVLGGCWLRHPILSEPRPLLAHHISTWVSPRMILVVRCLWFPYPAARALYVNPPFPIHQP